MFWKKNCSTKNNQDVTLLAMVLKCIISHDKTCWVSGTFSCFTTIFNGSIFTLPQNCNGISSFFCYMVVALRRSSILQNKSLDTDGKKYYQKLSCHVDFLWQLNCKEGWWSVLERLQTLQLKEKGKWEALLCLKTRRSVFHFSLILELEMRGFERQNWGSFFKL